MLMSRFSRIVRALDDRELAGSRTDLVHVPTGADSSLFGGWGVRI
jgi:hypothetical protein